MPHAKCHKTKRMGWFVIVKKTKIFVLGVAILYKIPIHPAQSYENVLESADNLRVKNYI